MSGHVYTHVELWIGSVTWTRCVADVFEVDTLTITTLDDPRVVVDDLRERHPLDRRRRDRRDTDATEQAAEPKEGEAPAAGGKEAKK